MVHGVLTKPFRRIPNLCFPRNQLLALRRSGNSPQYLWHNLWRCALYSTSKQEGRGAEMSASSYGISDRRRLITALYGWMLFLGSIKQHLISWGLWVYFSSISIVALLELITIIKVSIHVQLPQCWSTHGARQGVLRHAAGKRDRIHIERPPISDPPSVSS
jgi:hypothetical protein